MTNVMLQEYSLVETQYSTVQLENGYGYDSRGVWEIINPQISKILRTIKPLNSIWQDEARNYALLYYIEEKQGLVLLDFSRRRISYSIAAHNKNIIDKHVKFLKKLYPPETGQDEGKIKVRFWYNTDHGPRDVIRTISVPYWDQITKNYNDETLKGLEFLMKSFKPSSGGGQLLIMTGPPGTGKSYYLRALLNSWQDWCSAEYVLDPENLFNGGQGYMAELVLRNAFDEEDEVFREDDDPATAKWKLLILEDAGELITANARDTVGQGLSRLLNLVDGIIGQGLRVLVLITTNEDITQFHDAVIRDGRCGAKIIFKPLSREKALEWLPDENIKLPDKKEFTLAELFALTKSKTVKQLEEESHAFGFQMR